MIYVYAAIAVAAIGVGFAGGWQTRGWKASHDEAAQARADARTALARAEKVDGAAAGLEQSKERIRVQTVTLTREVERLVDRPVYRDRCLDDDGLRLVAAAAAGASAPAGEPAPAVPAAAAAD